MRTFVLAVVVLISTATPARADGGLTGAVAAAWFPRAADGALHSIAHQRVTEISACGGCMTHDLMRPGTWEVLAFNYGHANPIVEAIRSWKSSAVHNSILSNAQLGRIGCAEGVAGETHYFACVLAAGPGAALSPPSGPTLMLPDTAMPGMEPGPGGA
jgi:hypothetical protein